jgi:hypothetical protein
MRWSRERERWRRVLGCSIGDTQDRRHGVLETDGLNGGLWFGTDVSHVHVLDYGFPLPRSGWVGWG